MKLGPKQTRWVEALRSGDFKQGKYTMHNEGTQAFCCLGVAAKVNDLQLYDYDLLVCDLRLRNTGNFVKMNDFTGLTFEQIADEIERTPSKYFEAPT